ncbi:hypothetical protein U1Q18_025601 [Sarracenia purpurea var. burkii]
MKKGDSRTPEIFPPRRPRLRPPVWERIDRHLWATTRAHRRRIPFYDRTGYNFWVCWTWQDGVYTEWAVPRGNFSV